MAEATIQGVVNELMDVNKVLHSAADMHLEALFNIERAVTAVDTKVGLLLEAPAIQDTLKQFSEDIVKGITGSFDAALAYQMKQDRQEEREEKGEVPTPNKKKGFGESVKSSFKAGLERGPSGSKALKGITSTIKDFAEMAGEFAATAVIIREFNAKGGIKKLVMAPLRGLMNLFSNLGSRLFIWLSGFQNMKFFEVLKNMTKSLSKLAIPLTLVIGTIGGIIEAFNYFNDAGEGVQSKFMAAIEGFVAGFLSTLLSPIDWIVNGIGDFFGIEWMQKLSLVEGVKLAVEIFFNVLEDMGQMFGELYESIAASAFGQGLKSIWESISSAFDSVMQGLVDAYNAVAQYVPGLPMIGEDTREKGKTSEDYKMEKKDAREAIRGARDSGLYDRNIFGTSDIDRSMVKDAPTNQLIGILNEGDLSDEDHMFVYEEVQRREKRTTTTTQKVGEKRGMDLGTTDTSMKADGKRGRTIETSSSTEKKVGDIVVEKDGKPVELTKKEADQVAAISAMSESMGNEGYDVSRNAVVEAPASPSVVNNTTNNSSVLQEVTVPKRAAKTNPSKGTIKTAMSREPEKKKTGYELSLDNPNVMVMPSSGKFRATNPDMPLDSGTRFFDTYEEAAEWAGTGSSDPFKSAANDQGASGLFAPGSNSGNKISGAQGAAAQSGELQSRQNDLSTAQAQQQQAASNVAVVDNSQQQSVVNNNTTSGVNPSPFDKSDRTHKRGSYRGT